MTDWALYLAYRCRQCDDDCINERGKEYTNRGYCRYCLPTPIPLLEEAPPVEPSEECGPIPPEVPWSELQLYDCRSCGEECLNWLGLECTRLGYCHTCYDLIHLPRSEASERQAPARRADG